MPSRRSGTRRWERHTDSREVTDVSDSKAMPAQRKSERGRTSPSLFYRQVIAELRKVVWPTQNQLTTYFVVVLVFVAVLMTLTSLLDLGLGKLAFIVFGGRSNG
jgi:preprotein translocase subunit SecE